MIGICIPAYEHSELLRRSLDSIRKQTYQDYKVFISDDSKTHEIEELLEEYNDLGIIYNHNLSPLGTSANVNRAIESALTYGVNYIKILFHDDWFSNELALEKMVRFLTNKKIDVLFMANYEVYLDHTDIHVCPMDKLYCIKKDHGCLFRGNYLGSPSNVIYRACDLMFDPEFDWLLDVDFYLRLLQERSFDYLEEPVISIGHDGDQLSDYYIKNPLKMLEETKRQLNKYEWLKTTENLHFYRVYRKGLFLNYGKQTVRRLEKKILCGRSK